MTKREYVSIALVKGILDVGVKTKLLNKYGLDCGSTCVVFQSL